MKRILCLFSMLLLVTVGCFADSFDFGEASSKFLDSMGLVQIFQGEGWKYLVMVALACFLLFLALACWGSDYLLLCLPCFLLHY